MIKRRWKCHEGIGDEILSTVRSNKDITTSGILKKLSEQDINVTWKLVNSYLVEFEEAKKTRRFQMGEKNKISFWSIV